MRLSVAVTVLCLSIVAISAAQNAGAAMTRRPTNIPAQPLGAALEALAKERDLQVIYRSDLVGGVQSAGAVGVFTPEQALGKLLAGTGLTYRYLNETTVTIAPMSTSSPTSTPAADSSTARPSSPADDANQKGGGSLWDRFLVAQAAPGQTASSPTVGKKNEPASDKKPVTLEEVIVTAQKREERLRDVPMSISVLSGETLDKSSFVGITEALNSQPGVVATAARQGGGTTIAIRGVGSSGPVANGSSPIAYYVDSVPFGLVKTSVAPDPNAYDLQRVEILRGPQGTLYGATAQNGVVRILTNDADLNKFEFKTRASLSSTDEGGENYRGDLAVNIPIVAGVFAARAVIGDEKLSGWIDSPVKEHRNAAELQNYRLKLNAQPMEALTIGLSTWLSRASYGAPSVSDNNGRFTGSIPEPMSTDFDAYGLKIGYDLGSVNLSSMTSYLTYKDGGIIDLSPEGLVAPLFTGFESKVLSEEALVNSTLIGSWRWSAGTFLRGAKDRTRYNIPAIYNVDWGDESNSFAVFGELTKVLIPQSLELTGGLRFFHDNVVSKQNALDLGDPIPTLYYAEKTYTATTPRLVLTWHPGNEVNVYGSYSEGFRSGFPQNSNVAKQLLDFPSVRPDKLRNYEIGTKADLLDRRISVDLALYYMDWRDVQQTLFARIPTSPVFVFAPVNGGSASGLGSDLSVTVKPLQGLSVAATISWNDLSLDAPVYSAGQLLFSKGDRLDYSSKYTGSLSAAYAFRIGAGFTGGFSASANYISKESNRGLATLLSESPWVLVGDDLLIVRSSFSISSSANWTVGVFADNLTNERGGMPAAIFLPEVSPRVRPRTVGMQLEYRY